LDGDARVFRRSSHLGEDLEKRERYHAQPNVRLAGVCGMRQCHAALGGRQRGDRFGKQGYACGCQLDLACRTAKKTNAQIALQSLDRLGERGLLHAQLRGGVGETSRVGDGDEVTEALQIHITMV
jgi:hypothetical protein